MPIPLSLRPMPPGESEGRRASVCLAQPVQVDVMGQRRERLVAALPRQRRYPFESR
jgi:hypothetical protein